MAQESAQDWRGVRSSSGCLTAVPNGSGEHNKIRVAVGTELPDLLQAHYPTLGDRDLLHAACWAAIGRPIERV
jgi:hypothetical protein